MENEKSSTLAQIKIMIINKFHLYVADDQGQGKGSEAEIYFQLFINQKLDKIIYCGYSCKTHFKKSKNKKNIFPALEINIKELEPMENITKTTIFKPTCEKCNTLLISKKPEISIEDQMGKSYINKNMILCSECMKASRHNRS